MDVNEAKLGTIIDQKLEAKFSVADDRLQQKLDIALADLFGKMHHYFDEHFSKLQQKNDEKFDQVFNMLDGIIGRLETDEVERAAIGVQLERHNGWIHQLARKTKTKLSAP